MNAFFHIVAMLLFAGIGAYCCASLWAIVWMQMAFGWERYGVVLSIVLPILAAACFWLAWLAAPFTITIS